MTYSQRDLAKKFDRGDTKGKASNMFIEGNTIYSYGHHFPIALRVGGDYLFNTSKYSVSTSCQQSKVRNQLTGRLVESNTDEIKKMQRYLSKYDVDSLGELKEVRVLDAL